MLTAEATIGLPSCWRKALEREFSAPYFHALQDFVAHERASGLVFPPVVDVFSALKLTPLRSVRVVILGQDPYHDDGQAHGLSFSVCPGIKPPPSLRNIFRELEADVGLAPRAGGCLEAWARQGVLLLNSVLTVRAHEANSHRQQGWEQFTDTVIDCVSREAAVAFVLWGRPARKKASRIDNRHFVIESAHPSPLSAHRGFFGSRPFSRVNTFLEAQGHAPINWQLSD